MNENLIKVVVERWKGENDPDIENFGKESYTYYAYGYGDGDIEWLINRNVSELLECGRNQLRYSSEVP